MYNSKAILGIIPARSGSKGLPHKNVRDFAGKPLMAWAILAALESGVLDEVYVSTDSEMYAAAARRYGAATPFLRPAALSGDSSAASEYIIHALTEYREKLGRGFDYFALMQPTSPFRTPDDIRGGVRLAVDEGLTSVVSFSPLEYDARLIHRLPGDLNLAALAPSAAKAAGVAGAGAGAVASPVAPASPAIPAPPVAPVLPATAVASPNDTLRQTADSGAYRVNGLLYVARCDAYEATRSFYGPDAKAYIVDARRALDIDDIDDFLYAEFLALHGYYSLPRGLSL